MSLLSMTVNGKPIELEVDPAERLAGVLRDRLGLIGTKIGCGEGECGACTVLVDGVSMLSCIYPAMKAAGREVVTIEGVAALHTPLPTRRGRGKDGVLHPVQQAFVEHFASQCGYCTPGFIMSTVALLQVNPHPSREQILEGLSGNLCRCTGYYPIIDAVMAAAGKVANDERPTSSGE